MANSATHSHDPLLQLSLAQGSSYTETCRYSDLQPDKALSLIYSQPVYDAQQQVLGVLCLCFNIADELHTIFSKLLMANQHSIMALVTADGSGRVISAVNTKWQAGTMLPLPAELYHQALQQALTRQCELGGQRYLVAIAPTKGYREYKTSDGYQNQLFACLLLRM